MDTLTVGPEEAGLSIGRLLNRAVTGMTRVKARFLLDSHRLRLNGELVTALGAPLAVGDHLEIRPPAGVGEQDIQVLVEDPTILVVLKPAGEIIPPSSPGRRLFRFSAPARMVLRVPATVSGVLVGARHPRAIRRLQEQFSGGGGTRNYLALVDRHPERASGDLPGASGWVYTLEQRYRERSLLRLTPPRALDADPLAALRSAGMRVVRLSGKPKSRLALHAAGVRFRHPQTGQNLRFDPPVPLAMRQILDSLEPVTTLKGPAPETSGASGPEPALRSPREILARRPIERR